MTIHLSSFFVAVIIATIYLDGESFSRGQGIESTTVSINQLSDQSTLNAFMADQSGVGQASNKGGFRITDTISLDEILKAMPQVSGPQRAQAQKELLALQKQSPSEMHLMEVTGQAPHNEDTRQRLYDIGTRLGIVPKPQDYIYSGFMQKPVALIVQSDWYTRETFNEKNPFLGTGVVDTFGTDTGVDVTNRYGLTFNPDFGYKYAARDLSAPNAMYSDGYVGQLNFSQRVFPLIAIMAGQPNATYNLREATQDDVDQKKFDIYPNFSINFGLNTQFTALDSTTLTKGNRVKGTQNSWDLAPNMNFAFNITKNYTIQLQPTWDDTMTSNNLGKSASGGTMQIQLRNQYTFELEKMDRSTPQVKAPPLITQSMIVTQYNGLFHDTNQEPLPTAPPAVFQNWANFGVSAIYKKMYNDDLKHPQYLQIRIDYSYQAFNSLYEGHTLVASLNLDF
jgi:hypothetical protein